ncbi:MAG: aconitase X swivel domain-containing protein [Lentihominibacter sp.]|jgi:predicted aconitase with swiveling domain
MVNTYKCRSISRGIGEGEALVCTEPIGFNFGVDVPTGTIVEHGHELEGQTFKDKVLIFPHGKGSTGGSYVVYQVACEGTAPAAIINQNSEVIIACGAIMGGIPVVDHMETDPYACIDSGDWVKVDAESGTVTVTKKGD